VPLEDVALNGLPEADREALMLAAWEGLSAQQAARVLGCSPTAFRIRLHRARRKLEASLDDEPGARHRTVPSLRPEELL
jgi:RNA polymerase sigma-70 factor (ECF subfamily)